MTTDIDTLVEMGFTREKAEKALNVTSNKGVEPAMEWLLAHGDEVDSTPTTVGQTTAVETPAGSSATQEKQEDQNSSTQVAKSLKCEECGKLFKSQEEVEYHAAKTGHSSFSESTEEKKPLTEEEKKVQMALLEEKMKAKRKEREEREKEELLEKERLRIKAGKDLTEAKQKIQEQEMKKMLDQRRRDKLEDKIARDKVRAQIQADKEARKAAALGVTVEPVSPAPQAQLASVISTSPKEYKETRIQLRLPDGSSLTHTFGAKEQLAAVRLFVHTNVESLRDVPYTMMITFPKKVFNEEDYEKPLNVLGLVPSAVIVVSKGSQQ